MPRVHSQKARKNIYKEGKRVVDKKTKSGYRLDSSQPANKNDEIIVNAGATYYWWKFRFGGKRISATYPKRSQLTQSGFLGSLYDLQDRISNLSVENKEDFDSEKEDILSEIESMKDQCQESLDNMPEQLQSAPTGELLQERIDALDSWYSEIEGVECDYDEDEIREEKKSEYEKEEAESEDDYSDRIDQETADAIQEKVNEAIEELSNASCDL